MEIYKNISITKKTQVCHISLDNPKKLNALSSVTLKEISKACEEIALNKKIKIVVISSTSKNFCLGLSEAKHVILSGVKFNALEMQNKGFLNETFDLEDKNKCLKKWISKFKKMPGLQLKMIKKSANELAFAQAKSIMHMEFDQFLLSRNN